jgi:hypothetical protein
LKPLEQARNECSPDEQFKGDGIMRSKATILGASLAVAGALLLCGLPMAAQDTLSPSSVRQAIYFDVSPPLRELAKVPVRPSYGFRIVDNLHSYPMPDIGPVVDPVEQNTPGGPASVSIGLNILGVGNGFPNYQVNLAPPDTNAAVGDTQVVQWVNVSYAVFDKTTGAIDIGPVAGNQLWSGFGGYCQSSNDGDIIAQWDHMAHRWVLHQNVIYSNPATACFAISTTPDATGTYYRFAFPLYNQNNDSFPDYPKLGTWTTSYVQTQNNFGGGGTNSNPCVYNRIKMLAGDPTAGQVCFQLHADHSLLPADIDSPTAPPNGQDAFLIGTLGIPDSSHIAVYSIHIDWSNPSGATITGDNHSQLVAVPPYNVTPQGAVVPQLGTTDRLGGLGDRLMYRFAYYNEPFPTTPPTSPLNTPHQHWYVNHSVRSSTGQIGVRWYEFRTLQNRVPVTALSVFQSGTYAPDTNYRWMGSIAQDKVGDIALGYSLSSSTMYPSIAFTGRTTSDPLGQMEAEQIIWAGTGSQADTSNRWGDYSSMAIDGSDGCTFWYTTEYYVVPGDSFNWSTRLASLKFSNCQ